MEIDEIKTIWGDLNARLEKTEAMNKKVLLDMLHMRRESARDKLMKYEQKFLIFCFLSTLFVGMCYLFNVYNAGESGVMAALFLACAAWQVYKIYLVKQMDVATCSTSELLHKAIRFKVITRMRTIVGLILLIPLLLLLFAFDERFRTTPMIVAVLTGGVIGLAIGLFLFFKNLKDIDSLVKAYKDMKELDD